MSDWAYTWTWCWECNCATVDSPTGRDNTCCARWWSALPAYPQWTPSVFYKWVQNNPPPVQPTAQQLTEYLDYVRQMPVTEDERLVSKIFNLNQKLAGSTLRNVQYWADYWGVKMPPDEELAL